MDRADNRIARCRTLLCAPPIPLHDCHPHDCHLHDCHPERSEGPAFRDCLLYVRVPWISAATRIHAACAVEAHGFSRGKGRCSSTGLQPLWNCGAGASPANAILNFHDCHPERSERPAFRAAGCPTLCGLCKEWERKLRPTSSANLAPASQPTRELANQLSFNYPVTQLLNHPDRAHSSLFRFSAQGALY